jgi:4-hydroxybenzoate polyprenyltransferase
MLDIRFLLKISRPRFWLYVFGPYLVGAAAGAATRDDFLRLEVVLFGLYFLLPANLLIYGVNDIFDWETDRLNPKKDGYEALVRPEIHRKLLIWIAVMNLPFLIAVAVLVPQAMFSFAGFLFFSVFYSATPIRAKNVPFIDSLFNILYVFPAAVAFQILTHAFVPLYIFLAAGLWTMAMHAYSAIPDIEADTKAGLSTIAMEMGPTWTHVFCLVCYFLSMLLCFEAGFPAAGIIGVFYLFLMISSLRVNGDMGLFTFYRLFPIFNAVAGFVLFWMVAWPKFF